MIIDKYIEYLRGRSMTPTTLISYRNRLEHYNTFLVETHRNNIENATQQDVLDYMQYLIDVKHMQASTRNTCLSIIKNFYHYLDTIKKQNIDKSILFIEKAKTVKKQPIFLNIKESDNLRDTLLYTFSSKEAKTVERNANLRSQAIICLLLTTGIRVSELINIQKNDMQEEEDKNGAKGYRFKIFGKGQKERYVYNAVDITSVIDAYIDKERPKLVERASEQNKGYLFLSNKGKPLTCAGIDAMIKRWAKKADCENADKISAHKLRHSYATNMLEAVQYVKDENGNLVPAGKKYNIANVSASMGHANTATTGIYTHSSEEALKDMQQRGWRN